MLAVAGLFWVVRAIVRTVREADELVRLLEGATPAMVGVDPVSGDRYGVRLTPLGCDELRQAREREAAIRRDPDHFATAG